MNNSVRELKQLIDERDEMMIDHCKDVSWAELCNCREERDWYTNNIFPLDNRIVTVANEVIVEFSIPCKKVKTVAEVYSNKGIEKLVTAKQQTKDEGLIQ